MPRRTDIHTILIIGSGPIVIGQGCEFDYSGVQACRALREEGYRIVLINSNPATIMTDPQFADATYIEPITPEAVEKILEREKAQGTPVDALLPTLGGQTGLNTGMACHDQGILANYNVKMIGADRDAIHRGEDRQVFKDLMLKIGLNVPRSGVVHNMDDARKVLDDIGLPLIIRPAFTLGGTGGGIAYNIEEFETIVQRGLDASPVTEVLIEQSVIGYKEFELEVVRDKNDNVIIVCGIENIDAMGVHTGDSITVAPIQTLTDKEYQRMRDASIAIIRAVGVETGGSNIQFGVNPDTGEMVVIEMNPRVSRSSALASKATGFPIAKIAAKLAVGYTLDELPNYITSRKRTDRPSDQSTRDDWELYTSACFEPTIDYCVIKIPRWTFEKFPDADETLTTQMKSVGEAMAIGRTFKEALQKGIRSMEVKRFGFGLDKNDKSLKSSTGSAPVSSSPNIEHGQDARARSDDDKTTQGESADGEWPIPVEKLRRKLSVPSQGRLYYIRYALKMGWTIEQIHELTHIDPWFLAQMKELVDFEQELLDIEKTSPRFIDPECAQSEKCGAYSNLIVRAKQLGYSDVQLATVWSDTPEQFRRVRQWFNKPVYKLVDTCAAEFEASTPYYYSTYETPYTIDGESTTEDEIRLTDKPKIIIIGGGPNRIGQGIEFDYCCVQAAFAAKELGFESVMINSNPETVSTDYDTSDLLFFEPLTHEDVLNICERLNGGAFTQSPEVGFVDGAEATYPSHVENIRKWLRDHRIGRVAVIDVTRAGPREHLNDLDKPSTAYNLVDDRGEFWCVYFAEDDPYSLWGAREGTFTAGRPLNKTSIMERFRGNLPPTRPSLIKGVVVQFGGQTPLNLARGLAEAGVPLLGTPLDSLEAAGDREKFRRLVEDLNLKQPQNGIARTVDEARSIARRIGYPVLVRPSFVLGGRAMEIVSDETQLNYYMNNAIDVSTIADAPVLIDKYLDGAIEVDVDCIADFEPRTIWPQTPNDIECRLQRDSGEVDELGRRRRALVIGVMEHIEEAGIHSGDSACAIPPFSLSKDLIAELKRQTKALALSLHVKGLMNVQYAVRDGEIYLIEVNPRASRTVPFVGKATGVPWAKIAAKVMAGKTLDELDVHEMPDPQHVSVKESVFPFAKFPGVDVILGPEMRSTGEVMGIDATFPLAFAKSQIAAGTMLPTSGTVFLSVRDADKSELVPVAKSLADCGFDLLATAGTHRTLAAAGIKSFPINKLGEGRPNLKDSIKNGKVHLLINTPTRKGPQTDEGQIRSLAVLNKVPIVTTMTGANAVARAIAALQKSGWSVKPLQAYFDG